jgi:hypothetical protein
MCEVYEEKEFYENFQDQTFKADDGSSITHHYEKAEVLWESFKSTLGSNACTSMYFDLATLIQNVQLPILANPFTMEEIQTALNDMPIDHAPGFNGFNGMFMKRC